MKAERDLLRLQAYLDHELSPGDAARVAEWLSKDDEARAHYDELRQIKTLISGNELERSVPETREFYWSQVERRIQSAANAERRGHSMRGHLFDRKLWARLGLPLAGVAAAAALLLTLVDPKTQDPIATSFQESEVPIKDVSSFSFHSPETGITVVWIETNAGN